MKFCIQVRVMVLSVFPCRFHATRWEILWSTMNSSKECHLKNFRLLNSIPHVQRQQKINRILSKFQNIHPYAFRPTNLSVFNYNKNWTDTVYFKTIVKIIYCFQNITTKLSRKWNWKLVKLFTELMPWRKRDRTIIF